MTDKATIATPDIPEPGVAEHPSQQSLRDICWDLGRFFPSEGVGTVLAFAPVQPRLGYLCWRIDQGAVDELNGERGESFHGARLVIRVYDVTDVLFDGFNAHKFFDIDISGLSGNHYLSVSELDRNLMAEVGFLLRDNTFCPLARSQPVWFDRDRPSSRIQLEGLYVGQGFRRIFPVENVLDAPVYERLHRELAGTLCETPLVLGLVSPAGFDAGPAQHRLEPLLDRLTGHCEKFEVTTKRFAITLGAASGGQPMLAQVEARSADVFAELRAEHQRTALDLVHGHDWPSVPICLSAQDELNLPWVFSLHSTEEERTRGAATPDSVDIREWERWGVNAADLVVVPHSAMRAQVISTYGAPAEKVVIIADVFEEETAHIPDPGEIKQRFGLHPAWPMVLFAGEVSHAGGADLLVDALATICRDNGEVQCLFAGDGPLRGELEQRVWHQGFGQRCRFVGDVAGEDFEWIMLAADFVVVPARTWQGEGLAQMAISMGKPVLVTHQSQIRCVAHGQNGFVTYDNPGSIIWGVRELLSNPLQGNMLRLLAKRDQTERQSWEVAAAEHYVAYETVARQRRRGG